MDKIKEKRTSMKYVNKARILSIICLVIVGVFAFGLLTENYVYLDGYIISVSLFSILAIVTFVVSLKAPKTKEEAEIKRNNRKKPLPGQVVAGTILCVLGGFFSIMLLFPVLIIADKEMYSTMGQEGLTVSVIMGICGLVLLSIGVMYLQGRFVESVLERKEKKAKDISDFSYEETYFSEETINNHDEIDLYDISSIDGMNGHDFEYFCADLLRKNGFTEVSVTKGSGDQGVDILAIKDGIKYAIQCKNYASPLSNTPVQEINAGKTFYNCHVGVVMTNSVFTASSKDLAQATGVILWDRDVLHNMMICVALNK